MDIITGAASGSTHVKAFAGATLALLRSFIAYTGATSGVRVGSVDRNGDGVDDILTTLGAPGGHLKVFVGLSIALLDILFAAVGPKGLPDDNAKRFLRSFRLTTAAAGRTASSPEGQ